MVVSIFFKFSLLLGEDSHFDEHIFQMGRFNHQLHYVYIYITGRLLAFDILVLSCFEAEILTDADSNCRVLAATKTGETGDRVKYGCHMKSPPTSSFLFRKSHQIRP